MIRLLRSAISRGVTPSASAATVIGVPGVPYAMTRRDLLHGNPDLLSFCARLLREETP